MNHGALSHARSAPWIDQQWRAPAWALAAALNIAVAAFGGMFGSVTRIGFVLACIPLGILAWRQGPESHLKTLLTLICFVPFLRRVVDYSAGYDPSGLMLVGPLLCMGVPGLLVIERLRPETLRNRQTAPVIIVAGCIFYALALTMFQGEWSNAASNAVKSLSPISYAIALISTRAEPERVIQAAATAFAVILPVMGLYGIYQYVDPPGWDQFWMESTTITSIGQPKPYEVRVFSVLNGPASFATFTAVGLLLVFFLKPPIWSLISAPAAAVALLLSMYRTAWISLAVGIVFCLVFRSTRRRAGASLAAIGVLVVGTIISPLGDVVLDRISTINEGVNDGSARERLEQFTTIWNTPDSGIFGSGYLSIDVTGAGSLTLDGMFISCWVTMGLVVGLICIAALFLAIGNAVANAWTDRRESSVIVGALACSAFTQMPLANIVSSELGFLFWAFVVMISASGATVGPALLSARRS